VRDDGEEVLRLGEWPAPRIRGGSGFGQAGCNM
jgi:hypothetical protein